MTELKTLLEIRNEIKERKPVFIRQDNPKRRKLNYKWRKPKGIHSKIRHRFKGRRKMPSPGYKSPIKVKGMHSTGLKIINAHSIDKLDEIKKQSEGIVVAKNVGMKKRLEIFKKAKELDIQVLNLNVDGQIKKIEDIINSKKKAVKEAKKEEIKKESNASELPVSSRAGSQTGRSETRSQLTEKEIKPKETKEELEKSTDENKKELEKKEKDKLLTKKV